MPPALFFGCGITSRLSGTDFCKTAGSDIDFWTQILPALAYKAQGTNPQCINQSNRKARLLIFIMCLSVGISLESYLH